MQYQNLSTSSVRDLHLAIHRALAEDDARLPHQREYGVRLTPDWKVHADALEAVLASRGVWFIPTGL